MDGCHFTKLEKRTLTLPGMARSNFKPRCFELLKVGTVAHVKFPKISWLTIHNNTWCTILKIWDQKQTMSTEHISLVSCPLEAAPHPKTRFFWIFEILLRFCRDTPYHACPKEIGGIIYVSTRIYVLPIPCPRACFHPKWTSTGSTEQVHVQAIHVCMLWAAVGVWVKSWAL
jgi:hypothetical protein